ncbi:unnamed protein product [Adineta ricciae]|uniref:Uncharacterized protein n=1 Tax=Adineta ricciae TaxID=249248 RepID=A0A813ZKT2_ADIRI|nr:unnamed protein product [Adineta ricciae]
MDSSSSVNIDDVDDLFDICLIIHMKSLILLTKQALCCECHGNYDDTNWKQAFDKYFMPFLKLTPFAKSEKKD